MAKPNKDRALKLFYGTGDEYDSIELGDGTLYLKPEAKQNEKRIEDDNEQTLRNMRP